MGGCDTSYVMYNSKRILKDDSEGFGLSNWQIGVFVFRAPMETKV